jgi:hypothetical protein
MNDVTASWKNSPRLAVALSIVVGALACSPFGTGSLLGGSPPLDDLRGTTYDDTAQLPGGDSVRLAGVRVEVVDGPKTGTFSISDSAGNYRLPGLPAGAVQLQATKTGFDPDMQAWTLPAFVGPNFTLGEPPHTLWGDVSLERVVTTVVPDTRVEILTGPNAGKVTVSDQNGRYRFDDLVASPAFDMRVSKPGYQTRTLQTPAFHHNQQRSLGMAEQ